MSRPPAQNPNRRYIPAAAAITLAGSIATGLAVKGEGERFYAYDDARPAHVLKPGDKIIGTLTNCIGHTDAAGGPPIVIGRRYSHEECMAILEHDRRIAKQTVVAVTPELYENPPTAAAMEDFVLNVGPSAYINSTMVKDFKAGRIEQGCRRLFDWKYGRVRGIMVVINGLLNRRQSEYEKCVEGL